MYRLIQFFKRYYPVFLYIILMALAINYYVDSTSYTRAKRQMASASVTGIFRETVTSVEEYLSLREANAGLIEEIALLRNELESYKTAVILPPEVNIENKYFYTTARVISNSVSRQNNYFIINKGAADGVTENMAVLTIGGATAGYVQECSDNYAVCMSILNLDFRLGGKIKDKDFFGSVYWDGISPRHIRLSDIPRYAQVAENDTIISVYSQRFPPESLIGVVDEIKMSDDGNFFDIRVKLDADMLSLKDVILVRFADYYELNNFAGDYFSDTNDSNNH